MGGGQEPRCPASPPWSRGQPPAPGFADPRCQAQDRSPSLEGGEIPQPHHGSTHSAPSKPQTVPSIFPPHRLARSISCNSVQLPARIQGAGADGAATRVCAPAEGTRRSQGEHTPPTRLPRSRRMLLCPVPASGRWHRNCHSSRSWSLLAIAASHGHCTARIQRENGQAESDPQARGGGSAGQNHALIYRPSQEADLHPPCGDSLAQSSLPPWSSHQCVAIPRGCPEQGETQVLFSSWNCLGKAEPRSIATASPQHPRKCLLPAPQLLHPVLTEMVPTHKETWCFTHGNELRNSCSARVQLWSPKSNSSAGAKGSRAGAGAQNSSHKGELSSNVKQCPALFPRFVECFCVWDTDSSKFLELCLLPANFPGTSSTLAANKPRCLQVEAPE